MNEETIATKVAAKPAVTKAAVTPKRATTKTAAVKPEKKLKKDKKIEIKVKVIRDSFTMPQADYNLITEIKQKALKSGLHVKKSELLRAGLQTLSKLGVPQLKLAVTNLEKIKTGRPKKV